MLVLGYVVATLAGATTIASDGPAGLTNIQSVVTAIMKAVGIDKISEDRATLRLAPPPQALPAPTPAPATVAASAKGSGWQAPDASDLDDEIPF